MRAPEHLITDEEIEANHFWHGNCPSTKREVVNMGLLKLVCGFGNGSTVTSILHRHGLLYSDHILNERGRKYLWSVYSTTPKEGS